MGMSQKNKDKLVGGLIGVLILLLGLWVKSLFFKEEKTAVNSSTTVEDHSQKAITALKDSATYVDNSNRVTQTNQNNGPVNNDFSRDKKVITNKVAFKMQVDTTPKVKVETNNGFVNVGSGNTYNQSIGKQQRHLQKKFIDNILPRYPKDYMWNFIVGLNDSEAENYANEIINYLNKNGYKARLDGWAGFVDYTPGITHFKVDDTAKTVLVTVLPNKND